MKTTERPFQEKVVWVTGSSRGIGRAIADHMASLGASVAVHGTGPYSSRAFNEADSLEAVAQGISAQHGSAVFPVHGDLTDEKTVKALAGEIRARFGRIDILVNSAGGDIGTAGTSGPRAGKPADNDALFISLEDLRTVLERNLMTCILVCREVAPEMIPRKSGSIVNIGSVDGLWGQEKSAIYATAKAAVHEYTRCLALLLKPHNVRVNAVAPGDIMTPRWKASRTYDPRMAVEENTLNRYGRPVEIARLVEFLVSDAASYITGQIIRADGGTQCWPA
jgi:3-oxoacyl-[acyl-carrier protein] reductase